MKKTIVLPIIALVTVATAGMFSVKSVLAFWPFDGLTQSSTNQSSTTTTTPTFLDRLIEKFNLNKDEVLQVATDFRSERQASMKAQFETRLNAAVTAGNLTEAQKNLIIQKHDELQSQREALQQWATENGIDMSYFGNGGMGRGRGGRGFYSED